MQFEITVQRSLRSIIQETEVDLLLMEHQGVLQREALATDVAVEYPLVRQSVVPEEQVLQSISLDKPDKIRNSVVANRTVF